MLNQTLADLILDGLATELSYMTTDEQAAALDRVAYLQTCTENELAIAAALIARAAGKEPVTEPTKLLLAHTWDPAKVDPTGWWVSEKLDGVRCFWDGQGRLWSRLGKPFTKAPYWFTDQLPRGTALDGELYLGRKMFNDTIRAIKGSAGWSEVRYRVFDAPDFATMPCEGRWEAARLAIGKSDVVAVVDQAHCKDSAHLGLMLKAIESLGGEGLMLRAPGSLYEPKRSKTLLKVKSFFDVEAEVVGYIPGKGKHAGRLGALKCLIHATNVHVDVGTGFTDAERENPPVFGDLVTIRYQELTPAGVPRFPVFVAARDYE